MTDLFLIEKRGLYYRPDSAGYTGLKSEAGRYSFEDAAVHGGPNGPDGSLDGISVWYESEAPEYSSGCAWDVRVKDQAYRQGYADASRKLEDAVIAERAACAEIILNVSERTWVEDQPFVCEETVYRAVTERQDDAVKQRDKRIRIEAFEEAKAVCDNERREALENDCRLAALGALWVWKAMNRRILEEERNT